MPTAKSRMESARDAWRRGACMLVVDNRGLACPQPVINTRRVIEVNPGETVASLVDSVTNRDNLLVMAEGLSRVAEWEEDGTGFRVIIHPASDHPAGAERTRRDEGPFVIVLASDRLGQGDETLGGVLMKAFLHTLVEVEAPDTLVCLNRGVFLTTEGSPVLASLAELAARGTEILSCGTCLDFYGLKEKLQVGLVSNMFTIVERLTGAARLLQW